MQTRNVHNNNVDRYQKFIKMKDNNRYTLFLLSTIFTAVTRFVTVFVDARRKNVHHKGKETIEICLVYVVKFELKTRPLEQKANIRYVTLRTLFHCLTCWPQVMSCAVRSYLSQYKYSQKGTSSLESIR